MRERREPGPDHPITITPADGRLVVRADGRVIVDTVRALRLEEASYPPVYYVPRADADMAALTRSDHVSYCPYKGEANYYAIRPGDNAVWTYEAPYHAVAAIAGHLAFYPDRVEAITLVQTLD